MNIFADFMQFGFIANHMLVIIALPEGLAGGVLQVVDPPC